MAKYCIDLLTNKERLAMFSKAARERAMEYDNAIVVAKYESLYSRVLAL
jgi:hypothetical protein